MNNEGIFIQNEMTIHLPLWIFKFHHELLNSLQHDSSYSKIDTQTSTKMFLIKITCTHIGKIWVGSARQS